MAFLFNSFADWKTYSESSGKSLVEVVLEYEKEQKARTDSATYDGLRHAWQVMREAVRSGLEEDMTSRSGMIGNGGKKVSRCPKAVLSAEFQMLVAGALAAKEVNSC